MYILTEKELKDWTSINIQKTDKLKVNFENIDFFYLKKLLSTGLHSFYTSVVFGATGITLTESQAQVLDLSKRYFAQMVYWDVLGDLPIKTTEKGAEMPDGTAPLESIKERRESIYARAEKIKNEILSTIYRNKDDFKEYYPFPGMIRPKEKQGFSPIVFYKTKWIY